MPNWNEPAAPADRMSLAMATGSRSWDWLVELRRQLKVDFQLLDDRQAAVLPHGVIDADGLAQLLASPPPELTQAIAAALQSDAMHAVTLGSVQVLCRGLVTQNRGRGVLVLARVVTDSQGGPAAVRTRLELMSSLLLGAIQAHLQSPAVTGAIALQHALPLWRLLSGVADKESDRDVVAAFAEAMAVWHDIELGGYVRTARGHFRRDVAMAGHVGVDSPISLPESAALTPLTLKRLPHAEVDGGASPFAQDPLFTLLRGGDRAGGWLILLSGGVDACDRDLLNTYLAILDLAVASASAMITARLQAAVAAHLWRGRPDAPREAAAAGLRELLELTEGRSAVLTVTTPGMPVWQVDHTRPSVVGHQPPAQLLVTGADEAPSVTLALSRDDGRQFTYAHVQAAEAAAVLLQSWVRGALSSDAMRAAVEPFDSTLERLASEAAARGNSVTAAVLSFTSPDGPVTVTQHHTNVVRRQLRESDAAGVLADGQLGLLFVQTTSEKAALVIQRIERALSEGAGGSVHVATMGVAARTPEDGAGELLPDARRNALQRRPRVDGDAAPREPRGATPPRVG